MLKRGGGAHTCECGGTAPSLPHLPWQRATRGRCMLPLHDAALPAALLNPRPQTHSMQNLVRGRGLFCRSLMKSQAASPGFTPVYAALTAVVNTKFPEIGELLLHRVVTQVHGLLHAARRVWCVWEPLSTPKALYTKPAQPRALLPGHPSPPPQPGPHPTHSESLPLLQPSKTRSSSARTSGTTSPCAWRR